MSRRYWASPLWVNTLCLWSGLGAATWASAQSQLLETLVVVGEPPAARALTAGLHGKTSAELTPGAGIEVSDWLQGLPGVQVDNRTNMAQDTRISLRGFGARSAFGVRGVALQVDGIPLSQADGQGQLSSVLLGRMAQVEVIRGPLAGLYGSGAGGVIALHSQVPERNSLALDARSGSHGLRRQQLSAAGRSGAWAGSVAYANSEQRGQRPHSAAEREQWAMQGFYERDGLQLRINHDQSRDPLLQDPLGLTLAQWHSDAYQHNALAEQFDTRKQVDHRQTSVSLRHSDEQWHWQANAWQGERDMRQFLAFSGAALNSSGGVVDLARDFSGANLSLGRSLHLAGQPLSVLVGLEQASMDDRRHGYVNNQGQLGDMRRNELGQVETQQAYSLVQWQPAARWQVYGGARYSEVDVQVRDYWITPNNPDDSGQRRFHDASWALGGSYQLGAGFSVQASSGGGFEVPTLTEMAYSAGDTGLNTELNAARIRQQELSLAFAGQTLDINLTGFVIDTRNELVVADSTGGRTRYRNAAATERQGAELFARWWLSPNWRTQLAITRLSARYSESQWQGNTMPGIAREQYQWDWQYLPWGSEVLVVGLGLHSRGRIASDDANSEHAPAYQRLDIGVEGRHNLTLGARGSYYLRWWANVSNLSNEKAIGSVIVNQASGRSFEPAPGRSWQLGVALGF